MRSFVRLFILVPLGGLMLLAQQSFSVPAAITGDSSSSPALYAGLYRSTDSGATWTTLYVLEAGLTQPEVRSLVVDPANPQTLYLATTLASGGVWKSSDRGATWTRAATGLPSGTGAVEMLAATELAPTVLYARVAASLYKSQDGAASWRLQSTLPQASGSLEIVRRRPSVMYFARGASVYRSQDEGATWTYVANLLPEEGLLNSITDVKADVGNPSEVYAALRGQTSWISTDGKVTYTTGVFRSRDSGVTWENVSPKTGPYWITVDPTGRTNVFYTYPESLSVCKSASAGTSWNCVSLAQGIGGARLWISPANPDVMYASSAAGLYRSSNAGDSWTGVASTFRPTLAKPSEALAVTLQPGGTSVVPLAVGLIESGAQGVPFTVSTSGEAWLSVSAASGTTPATLSVTVKAQGLAVSTYNASVRISAPATANGQVVIPVRVTVTERPSNLPEFCVSTVAGDGRYGFAGDGGPATSARLARPEGLALDSAGNLWVADTQNGRVRKITPDGKIATVAGSEGSGFSGDGGKAVEAKLNWPVAVVVDTDGSFFIADSSNQRIRSVDKNGLIRTFAGSGESSLSNTAWGVRGLVLDSSRQLVFANWLFDRVYRANTQGAATSIAGGGAGADNVAATSAALSEPYDVVFDSSGNLYIVERGRHRVRKVDAKGVITTVAGNGTQGFQGDGGRAVQASLSSPQGVAVDSSGNLYIADTGNHRIRMVSPDGTIQTIAGTGESGYSGDNGSAALASFSSPADVVVDRNGNLYVADRGNNRIRRLELVAANVPRIQGVVNGAGFQAEISPGSWFVVTGTNLASSTRTWRDDEIVAGVLPRELDGVRVRVNGADAFLYYISPTQLNALAPDGIPDGAASVEVVNNGVRSSSFTVTSRSVSPAFFVMLAPSWVAARHHPDYHLVARPEQFPNCGDPVNCPVREAEPGEIVLLYGTGFGPVNPPIAAGKLFETPNQMTTPVRVRFGDTWVEAFGGLASPGLYQIAVQVPGSAPDGDLEVQAEVAGKLSPAAKIPVRRGP